MTQNKHEQEQVTCHLLMKKHQRLLGDHERSYCL